MWALLPDTSSSHRSVLCSLSKRKTFVRPEWTQLNYEIISLYHAQFYPFIILISSYHQFSKGHMPFPKFKLCQKIEKKMESVLHTSWYWVHASIQGAFFHNMDMIPKDNKFMNILSLYVKLQKRNRTFVDISIFPKNTKNMCNLIIKQNTF